VTDEMKALVEAEARAKAKRSSQPAQTEGAIPKPEIAATDGGEQPHSGPVYERATCPTCEREYDRRFFIVLGRRAFEQPECDACQEARHTKEEEEKLEEAKRADEIAQKRRKEKINEWLAVAGANPLEHRQRLADCRDEDFGAGVLRTVREFVDRVKKRDRWDPMRGLYLYGATGTGKSHLATAIVRELLETTDLKPVALVFDHALSLIGEIQDTYSEGTAAGPVIRKRVDATLWVLDDLGTEKPSEDVVRRLTEIFTRRAMHPTLVTSNLHPSELEGRHADLFRVASRLGPAYFKTVEVKGRDRRFDAAA
jgi:DNA replication protein DnaC